MKPTRKVSRGSFMARISSHGGHAPGGKGGESASDHDLGAPHGKGGSEHDSDQSEDPGDAA